MIRSPASYVWPLLLVLSVRCGAATPALAVRQDAPEPVRPDGFTFAPADRYDPNLPSLEVLLGYPIGTHYTEHRDLVAALAELDAASDRIEVEAYGETPEGRPLLLAFVSSRRNVARREEIAKGLRELADRRIVGDEKEAARRAEGQPAIVWLSYNVHGNEPSSSEAALAVLWHLAAAQDEATKALLDDTLIVIDPCLNPDGRDRYVHWFNSMVGAVPDPEPASREHDEPAPGGRVNHYYFDMNRDWAYATQDETRARLAALQRFPPQVHVDFHEMYANSSYFFFPADLPRNQNLPRSTVKWGERFGAGNAAAFDSFGWLYYSGEQFDLLYPGYGDSFPSLRGAIGMTYEQAGHAAGGLAYRRDDGEILTLEDRVAHHFESSLATITTTHAGRRELLQDWWRFHADAFAEGEAGPMREIAITPGSDRATLRRLAELLLLHGLEVDLAEAAFVAKGVHGYDGIDADVRVLPEGTLLVSLAQPEKRLAKALLEPRASVERTTFYDISAWSLPFAYGLAASWLEQPAAVTRQRLDAASLESGGAAELLKVRGGVGAVPANGGGKVLGYLLPWGDGEAPAALLDLLGSDVDARMLPRPFTAAGRRFPAGSVFVRQRPVDVDLASTLREVAAGYGVDFVPVTSAFTPDGIDLGSEQAVLLKPPHVLLVASDGQGFGELRFLFERELFVPFTCVSPGALAQVKLHDWNVIVIPDDVGGLDAAKEPLQRFLQDGGTVIAFGGAAAFFSKERSGLTEVTLKKDDEATKEAEKQQEEKKKVWRKSAQLERESTLEAMPGALFEVELDPGHPLAFGLPERIPLLATGRDGFKLHGGGTKIGRFVAGGKLSGFAGEQAVKELGGQFWLVEAHVGAGHALLFSESPTFRLGFRGPIRVLFNALAFYSR